MRRLTKISRANAHQALVLPFSRTLVLLVYRYISQLMLTSADRGRRRSYSFQFMPSDAKKKPTRTREVEVEQFERLYLHYCVFEKEAIRLSPQHRRSAANDAQEQFTSCVRWWSASLPYTFERQFSTDTRVVPEHTCGNDAS